MPCFCIQRVYSDSFLTIGYNCLVIFLVAFVDLSVDLPSVVDVLELPGTKLAVGLREKLWIDGSTIL